MRPHAHDLWHRHGGAGATSGPEGAEADAEGDERKDAGYSYNYDVDIHNTGDVPVQLMTRHWVFTGADGRYEEVRMPGAGGKKGSIFDQLEDTDFHRAVEKCAAINKAK